MRKTADSLAANGRTAQRELGEPPFPTGNLAEA